MTTTAMPQVAADDAALAPLIRKDHQPTAAEIERELHRMLAEQPEVRPLPPGHDDPRSPYFVPAARRETYVRVPERIRPSDPDIARMWERDQVELAERFVIEDREREVWEDNRKVAAGLGSEFLARFLAKHADESGAPILDHAHSMSGWTHTPPQPGNEHMARAAHVMTLRASGPLDGLRTEAARRVRDRIAATCDVCAAYVPPPTGFLDRGRSQITRRGQGGVVVQLCPNCELVARFVIALDPTPDRMPRVSAVAHALAAAGDIPGPINDKAGDDLAERVSSALARQVRHSQRRKGGRA